MWDAVRKCFDTVENIQKKTPLPGWRKLKSIRKDYKSLFRATSQIVFKGKKEAAKKKQVKLYLSISNRCIKRFEQIPNQIMESNCNLNFSATMLALDTYLGYAKKWADQIERRLIKVKNTASVAASSLHFIYSTCSSCLATLPFFVCSSSSPTYERTFQASYT